MKRKTLWNERFGVLAASGSPGSALAHALGSSVSQTILTHSNNAIEGAGEQPGAGIRILRALKAWLRETIDRFAESSWNREMRQIEAYLGQARDTADLEYRMRHLHDTLLSRARMLR